MRRVAAAVVLTLCAACSGDDAPARDASARTYRAIAGFSMGAMGATFVGASNPGRFDAIGALGGPVDFDYLLGYLERAWVGGFCTLEELEAVVAAAGPAALDDPAQLPCMRPASAQAATLLPEHEQSFVRWIYGDNGGSFDRDAYLDLFTDLSLAFGNPLTWNPDSPFLPPGVTAADLARGAALCDEPVVIEGLFNAEYNPAGSYSVITFCDGEEPALVCAGSEEIVDWCAGDPADVCAEHGGTAPARGELARAASGAYAACFDHRRPVPFALAVDLNRNGRRDYGEPIVVNAHERWDDVGADGCANDREDGAGGCLETPGDRGPDPNGDDYDWRNNPTGTERNWRYDAGEPYRDDGLDGVPGTADHGEGDGAFTESPSRARFRAFDADALLAKWSNADLDRIGFYADGGVRDLFNFGVSAAHVWSAFASRRPAGAYLGAGDLPGAPTKDTELNPLAFDPAELPRRMLFLYGDPNAAPAAIRAGDGDHVGTSRQLLNRFYLFLRWLSAGWDGLEDPPADRSSVQSRTHDLGHRSAALGGVDRNFTVVLPPGYDDPRNAKARYPVLFLLHGYGMRPGGSGGFAETALLFDGAMASGALKKTIVVFPSGRCCFEDEAGNRSCLDEPPEGFARECRSGTFFVDRSGYGAGDDTAYGAAILELLDEVDARFRTLSAGR